MEDTENKPIKGNRDLVMERFSVKYPDKEYADDDAVFGQINDDYADYDSRLAAAKERDDKLNEMFAKDPRSAHFLSQWGNGEDPAIALVRMFGEEIRDALDDPQKLDEIAAANKEYVEKVAEEAKYKEEYTKNIQETNDYLEQLAQQGKSDDEIDAAMAYLQGVITDGIMGKFSPETIDMAFKAIGYDKDVAMADRTGEVRGRNAKIEEKLRRRSTSDGTAQLDGKNGNAAPTTRPSLGALDNYGDGTQSIWERGGEKRTKVDY